MTSTKTSYSPLKQVRMANCFGKLICTTTSAITVLMITAFLIQRTSNLAEQKLSSFEKQNPIAKCRFYNNNKQAQVTNMPTKLLNTYLVHMQKCICGRQIQVWHKNVTSVTGNFGHYYINSDRHVTNFNFLTSRSEKLTTKTRSWSIYCWFKCSA